MKASLACKCFIGPRSLKLTCPWRSIPPELHQTDSTSLTSQTKTPGQSAGSQFRRNKRNLPCSIAGYGDRPSRQSRASGSIFQTSAVQPGSPCLLSGRGIIRIRKIYFKRTLHTTLTNQVIYQISFLDVFVRSPLSTEGDHLYCFAMCSSSTWPKCVPAFR